MLFVNIDKINQIVFQMKIVSIWINNTFYNAIYNERLVKIDNEDRINVNCQVPGYLEKTTL